MSFTDESYLEDLFVKLAKENTRSDYAHHDQVPSTPNQKKMALELVDLLKSFGLPAYYNEKSGFAIGKLASNCGDPKVTPFGIVAHVDTAEFSAENVQPQVHKNYQGNKLTLSPGIDLDPEEFPALKELKGQTLITTDGTTLLGVDDKAGITGLIGAIKYLVEHPDVKHGDIFVGFGPDEEIGLGGTRFDPADFPGAEFAYTLDNGQVGELQYETFNATEAHVHIKGTLVHPGNAYGLMVNATTLLNEFLSAFPQDEVPEKSKDKQGFFMMIESSSEVDHADAEFIIRDFDWDKFTAKEQFVKDLVAKLNKKYGKRFTLTMRRQYENIANSVRKFPYVVNLAEAAYKNIGLTPRPLPFRGGTDGNFISQKGIPTPNLFNGGGNYHGRYEYVTVQQLDKLAETLVAIAQEHVRQSQEGRDNSPLPE